MNTSAFRRPKQHFNGAEITLTAPPSYTTVTRSNFDRIDVLASQKL